MTNIISLVNIFLIENIKQKILVFDSLYFKSTLCRYNCDVQIAALCRLLVQNILFIRHEMVEYNE